MNMKTSIYCLTASCLLFSATAWSHEGMMHHGDFADKMFKEMDSNNDGAVSKAEFDAFHEKHFKEVDTNHDGKISHEEMDAAHNNMKEQARDKFEARFNESDTNHDGALTKDEAKKMPMISEHFDEIDANHDGRVSLDEIRSSMESMHHGHDGMHDGNMHGGAMRKDDKAK
jgi:Ca2+-binding EF-hand superfamily protein